MMGPGEELVLTSQKSPEEVKACLKKPSGRGLFQKGADVSIDHASLEILWTAMTDRALTSPVFRGEIFPDGSGTLIRGKIYGAGLGQFPLGLQVFFFAIILILSLCYLSPYPLLFLLASYIFPKVFHLGTKEQITSFLLDACSTSLEH